MRGGSAVVLVAATGLLLRLAALALMSGSILQGDPLNYLHLAQSVAKGDGLNVFDAAYGMSTKAMYPPLYPLLLAMSGATQLSALILNSLIALGTAAAMIWLASMLGHRRAGLIAAAVFFLWPANILSAAIPQKEGLAAMLAVVAAALVVRASQSGSHRTAILFGVVTGLIALTQPALAPLPAIFALSMFGFFQRGTWIRMVAIAVPAAVAVMLPWWIRNWLVFGSFVPLTTSGGLGLWIGTFSPTGSWIPPAPHLLAGNELAMSRLAATEAWQWIVDHPLEYLGRCLTKIPLSLFGGRWEMDRLLEAAQLPPSLFKPPFLLLASLLNAAALIAIVRSRNVINRLALAGLAQLVFVQIWFELSERHSSFLLPLFMLSASAGAIAEWQGRASLSAATCNGAPEAASMNQRKRPCR